MRSSVCDEHKGFCAVVPISWPLKNYKVKNVQFINNYMA